MRLFYRLGLADLATFRKQQLTALAVRKGYDRDSCGGCHFPY